MSSLQLPQQSPLQDDWCHFERRSARHRLKSLPTTPPAAVWINRPALQGRARPRILLALLVFSGLLSALAAFN